MKMRNCLENRTLKKGEKKKMKENLDWLKRFNPKKTCSKETTENLLIRAIYTRISVRKSPNLNIE